ncbi:MAG: ATP-binding protein [Deltaproteobacteria bacterium]|nr:ATP-binding protein [Deltaproteobacteria bacterium]
MKKIPSRTQTFKELIEKGYIYVDKTDLLPPLIERKAVFLSRPRRFGKSLLLSTFKSLLEGEVELFKGLKIMDQGFEFKKYPVIRLDMSMTSRTPDITTKSLLQKLANVAESFGLKLIQAEPGETFVKLVIDINRQCGQKVVVLVDEYDYPVNHNIDDSSLMMANSKILSDFYVSFKSIDSLLEFVFVTGVTRYAMMGLSAGLNNLYDISLNSQYAAICGFTLEELDINFREHYKSLLEKQDAQDFPPLIDDAIDLLKDTILSWYDGYSWDGITNVLNPFSIINLFDNGEFKPYWELSSPSVNFITNLVKDKPWDFTKDKMSGYEESQFTNSLPGVPVNPVLFMFQTGYLTIDKITTAKIKTVFNGKKINTNKKLYSFKTPNTELETTFVVSLNEVLFNNLVKNKNEESIKFKAAISSKNPHELTNIIGSIFSAVPSDLHTEKESFYHSLLATYLLGLGLDAKSEDSGSGGYLDILVRIKPDVRVVIELKYSHDPARKAETRLKWLAKEALKTIKEKEYDKQYRQTDKKVVNIGVGVYMKGLVKAIFE